MALLFALSRKVPVEGVVVLSSRLEVLLFSVISKVLAGHANTRTFPTLKLVIVDEIRFLHALVEWYRCIGVGWILNSVKIPSPVNGAPAIIN